MKLAIILLLLFTPVALTMILLYGCGQSAPSTQVPEPVLRYAMGDARVIGYATGFCAEAAMEAFENRDTATNRNGE